MQMLRYILPACPIKGPCLLLVGVLLIAGARPAAAQEAAEDTTCTEALEAAEEAYLNAEFETVIDRVAACLDQSEVPAAQSIPAYRLLSLAHLRLDEIQDARSAIVNILGIDPSYEADPIEDPPEYVSLVSIVRREVQPEVAAEPTPAEEDDGSTPFFRRTSTWLSLVGSVAVGGVVTFLTLGQGSDDGGGGGGGGTGPDPLPPPPGTPSGN